MGPVTRELIIFTADNLAQFLTGIPIDLRPYALAAFAATYKGDANAPTLYTYDPLGHMIPTPDRVVSPQEKAWMDDYNKNVDTLLRSKNDALDRFLSDALPLTGPKVPETCNRDYNDARAWTRPKDPLVLDLDGDGIEATAIDRSAPVLFDHDADGIQAATGWIKADDGIVVLDLNGNGTIDTGRELFGDNTLLPSGGAAANGFEAIAQYDTNADGKINAADAVYTQLRIWQDANQDGVSQANELKTLGEMGIASINVVGQASTINLGNGNTQPWSGSYTRTNGTTGDSGTPELSGSLLPASNNFLHSWSNGLQDIRALAKSKSVLQYGCQS